MVPVRTCIGCRARSETNVLLRIVSVDNTLVVDEDAVLQGRGAWIHPTNACFSMAVRRKAFGRALRQSGTLDTQPLENRLNG
ncbi:YlxR family protein [Lysinibacter sp. HNR]|uniref:YlxR family protein n=1 Tax=Lysinibacter sp. HNR TaxID=3031408 RepID=UPI00243517FA|nr:YlxR family protein [Lysinibacter sp. HNR]WGD37992.1 YlxR family protein [Lysinibacter sp. HNR]